MENGLAQLLCVLFCAVRAKHCNNTEEDVTAVQRWMYSSLPERQHNYITGDTARRDVMKIGGGFAVRM